MPLPEPVPRGVFRQPLGGVFADRRKEEEASFRRLPQEALLDQRAQSVEVGVANLLGRVDVEAPGEDRQPAEQLLLVVGEKVVAPVDRRAERSLPFGRVAGAAAEEGQALLQAFLKLGGCEDPRPGGRELDCEREIVQPATDLAHVLVGLERRLG